jgi:hypothetical protein
MPILPEMNKEELQAWIKARCDHAKSQNEIRKQQGGPLLEVFDGLSTFASFIVDAVAEDLGELPEKIHELILVDTCMSTEGKNAFPIYTVELPDRNLRIFLWDYHNDGTIEAYYSQEIVDAVPIKEAL